MSVVNVETNAVEPHDATPTETFRAPAMSVVVAETYAVESHDATPVETFCVRDCWPCPVLKSKQTPWILTILHRPSSAMSRPSGIERNVVKPLENDADLDVGRLLICRLH